MTVIIKGKDMPENCGECWDLDERGDYPMCNITGEQRGYDFDIRKKKMDKCPIGDVPTLHGRLIDADKFDSCVREACGIVEEELTTDFKDGVQATLWILKQIPAVIEAEEESDERTD